MRVDFVFEFPQPTCLMLFMGFSVNLLNHFLNNDLLGLKERGGAKILTLATVDKDNNFLEAIQEVLTEPSDRLNMQRLARLHSQWNHWTLPLFWIEFVIRHKGAAHLRTESYRLPWYSYHSVDAALSFLAAVAVIILLPLVFSRYVLLEKSKKKKKEWKLTIGWLLTVHSSNKTSSDSLRSLHVTNDL